MNPKSEVLIVAVLVVLLACVQCQLTFSPDWGKRSGGASGAGGFFEPQQSNCKSSSDMLTEIIRFVQSQSQLFHDCRHRE